MAPDQEEADSSPFRSAAARARFLERYDRRAERWPVASESRLVETSLGRTFVRVSGPPEAPPLVLLHGIGSNSLTWDANVAALSGSFRVHAVDAIYDHGRSLPSAPARNKEDLLRWLDELFTGLAPAGGLHLVGLSYGGWLASQYALRFPNRVRKLVLLAPVFTVLPLSAAWIVRAVLCVLPFRWFTRSFMLWLLEDLARKGDDGRATVEAWAEDSFLAMRSFKPRRAVNPTVLTDEELQRLSTKTLYLVGENEKIYSAQAALERLGRVAPGLRTELIPGAGHDLTATQAALVNDRVLAFLRSEA
jgi:pimeloyl-ACP methyl ester carboxylesterase